MTKGPVQFLLVVTFNALIAALILEVLSARILRSFNYFSGKFSWYWLSTYDREMNQPIGSDTLVLGCSVAQQLFPIHARSNYKVTTGVDIAASTFLYASKAVACNPGLKTIVVITNPYSLTQPFGSKYTYNVFIKPYYNFSNFRYFDGYLHRQVARRPFGLLAASSFFKILPVSDIDYSEGKAGQDRLSQYACHYLLKLKTLAADRGIRLVLIPSPVAESAFKGTSAYKALKKDIIRQGFSDLFGDYFDRLLVYPDSCFRDRMHFRQDFLDKHRQEIIGRLKL